MNEDVIADLKQFITATVNQQISQQIGQQTAELKAEIGGVKAEIQELRQEMRDGFAGVADTMEPTHAMLDDHEIRLTKLEQQTV